MGPARQQASAKRNGHSISTVEDATVRGRRQEVEHGLIRTGTPILRLRMDNTNKVTVGDDATPSTRGSPVAGDRRSESGGLADGFVMKGVDRSQVVDRGEYTEVFDTDGGFSWGEKRANDGHWEERWVERKSYCEGTPSSQTSTSPDSPSTSSPSPVSPQRHSPPSQEVWRQQWKRSEVGIEVKRHVQQLDQEDETVLEEWFEEELTGGPVSVRVESKNGIHHDTGRVWKTETRYDKKASASRDAPSSGDVEVTPPPEVNELVPVFEMFEEGLSGGEMRRRTRETRTEDGCVVIRLREEEGTYPNDGTDEVITSMEERYRDETTGATWGCRQGIVDSRESHWYERWRKEEAGGDDEVSEVVSKEEKSGEDPDHEWGSSDVVYRDERESHKRWETSKGTGSHDLINSHFSDEWSVEAPDETHEKRKIKNGVKKRDECIAVKESDEGCVLEFVNYVETWRDDGVEHVSESNVQKRRYRYPGCSLREVRGMKDDTKCERVLILNERSGTKRGARLSEEAEWGENWSETERPDRVVRAEGVDTVEPASSSTPNDEILVSRQSGCGPDLHLSSRFVDKWWKETGENKWGEKRYERFDCTGTGTEVAEGHEKWYDNGYEAQTDRWECLANGKRRGEKIGWKRDGSQWAEKWGDKGDQQDDDGEAWVDKSWTEYKEGQRYNWGETEGRAEGGKKWSQRWGRADCEGGGGGNEWVEKNDDDGVGNVKTEKTGRSWRRGDDGAEHVVNWYSDRYGECIGQEEKWAHKEGTTDGEWWTEKWNETPTVKSAVKIGKNNQGDEWEEEWREDRTTSDVVKFAKKKGRNPAGDEWVESWLEKNDKDKTARKTGKNAQGEEWEEQWGEIFEEDGGAEKWCSKWAQDASGNRTGKSWGDRWDSEGDHKHGWGEEWHGDGNGDKTNKWTK
eukprot:GHVN01106327.1.p1 GENE.GHVN01106327.1~~GHVN01106327.1.p1  ORF type:complete len:913 (+),score=281.23 GHVN01106327.1:111-2849(+)